MGKCKSLVALKSFLLSAPQLSGQGGLSYRDRVGSSLVVQTVKRLPAMQKPGFHPRVGKSPWRRKWQPTPVSLPGESHGRRSLVGYSPRGRKESDRTEWLHFHFRLSGTSILCVHTLRAHHGEHLQSDAARKQVSFPSWIPLGLTSSPSTAISGAGDREVLCLLIWQEIFHFSMTLNPPEPILPVTFPFSLYSIPTAAGTVHFTLFLMFI